MKILPNLILLKKNYIYILGDFNIQYKLVSKSKSYRMQKQQSSVSESHSNDVKNKSYLQFCTMFGLTQIIKSPTSITCSSTLIDHILASLPDRIFQEGRVSTMVVYHLIAEGHSIQLRVWGMLWAPQQVQGSTLVVVWIFWNFFWI